ncbi:MAG TPA: monofunctional biosynthetic peptidoglycan transglycosylase [Vicinamibacterales bacterium]|nr:monofunctional biosynthetic peptidoglycan transglycosylase [Vicinamibacterales bacterium]
MRRLDVRRIVRWTLAAAAAAFGALVYLYVTLPDVRPLRNRNPETTAFMELRAAEARAEGKPVRRDWRWVPYARISPALRRAVIAAEDGAFWEHRGVDVHEIKASLKSHLPRGRFPRGASTITQQLAKNLYLSPSRDPIRKLRELFIARRLEAELSKRRILELYLNVIEWGHHVYGAEAAARKYFGKPAAALNVAEAALLAGAIVNPRVLNPARPSTGLRWRQRLILRRLREPGTPGPLPPAPDLADAPGLDPAAVVPHAEAPLDPTALFGPPEQPPAPPSPAPDGPAQRDESIDR